MAEPTSAEKQLLRLVKDPDLVRSLAEIRAASEAIWSADAPRIIRDFTDHGIAHSQRLSERAVQLLSANTGDPLTSQEAYLVLAGIYLHDIGMQCDVIHHPDVKARAEELGAEFSVEFTAPTASTYQIEEQKAIRTNHHYLAAAWIECARLLDSETTLGPAARSIPATRVGDVMDVCKYHARLPIGECPGTFAIGGIGRKQLVAALVRFADELDVDVHRVSIQTVRAFRLDPANAVYWWLHNNTTVSFPSRAVVQLTVCLEPEDFRRLENTVRDVFIDGFKRKNEGVLTVLAMCDVPVVISSRSGVMAHRFTTRLPPEIIEAFEAMRQEPRLQKVNVALLYQVYMDPWLDGEGQKARTLRTSGDRRLFAGELAMEMLRTDESAIHYSRFPERILAHFGLEGTGQTDHFETDVRTANFLTRDSVGYYRFVRKYFMEFLAGTRLHRLMREDSAAVNGPVLINEEVRGFLRDLFALQPKSEPDAPCQPPPGFVWVPPGDLVTGGHRGPPLQVCRLDAGFFACLKPVTNSQYARFVREMRYPPPWYWRGPDAPAGYASHPVVYVSWDDADAYATWVGGRLPTELEWEKAARGYDGREYPWGEWEAGRCNLGNDTTCVGRFSPDGDSPYGLQDVAGQVWEWTVSRAEEGSRNMVLRGGSFGLGRDHSQCGVRREATPTHRWPNYGFRVVMSLPDPT